MFQIMLDCIRQDTDPPFGLTPRDANLSDDPVVSLEYCHKGPSLGVCVKNLKEKESCQKNRVGGSGAIKYESRM